MRGARAIASSRLLPGIDSLFGDCTGGSKRPGFPRSTFLRVIAEPHDPALAHSRAKPRRNIGKCCDPAAGYSCARAPGFDAEFVGTQAAESPMVHESRAGQHAGNARSLPPSWLRL